MHTFFLMMCSSRLSEGSLILYIRFVPVLTWSYGVKSTSTHSLFSELCFDYKFFYFFFLNETRCLRFEIAYLFIQSPVLFNGIFTKLHLLSNHHTDLILTCTEFEKFS